jgi:hypothetical protein
MIDVGYWPLADIPICTAHVCFQGPKRTSPIALQMFAFDPKRTSGGRRLKAYLSSSSVLV